MTAQRKVTGSISIDATGLATSARQDTGNASLASILVRLTADPSTATLQSSGNVSLAAIDAKLPAAFSAGGGVKVGLSDALPAGNAVIGSCVPSNAAGVALLPTASALSNASAANPTTTKIGAVLLIREENSDTLRRPACDTSNRQYVNPSAITMALSTRSPGIAYEFQRGIAFGFNPGFVRVFLDPAYTNATAGGTVAYIVFVNGSAVAMNGDPAYGADSFPIEAGKDRQIDMSGCSESFPSGFRMVISDLPNQVLFPVAEHGRFTAIGN